MQDLVSLPAAALTAWVSWIAAIWLHLLLLLFALTHSSAMSTTVTAGRSSKTSFAEALLLHSAWQQVICTSTAHSQPAFILAAHPRHAA